MTIFQIHMGKIKKEILQTPQNDVVFENLSVNQLYPGICNLCFNQSDLHKTEDCEFSTILYHATNKCNFKSIIENGLHPHRGRLGKALYCSDDKQMCMKFIHRTCNSSKTYYLLKIKVMLTDYIQIQNRAEKVSLIQQYECIKCPYFTNDDGSKQYQWALYSCEYKVVGYAEIEFRSQMFMKYQTIRLFQKNKLINKSRSNRPIDQRRQIQQQRERMQFQNQLKLYQQCIQQEKKQQGDIQQMNPENNQKQKNEQKRNL